MDKKAEIVARVENLPAEMQEQVLRFMDSLAAPDTNIVIALMEGEEGVPANLDRTEDSYRRVAKPAPFIESAGESEPSFLQGAQDALAGKDRMRRVDFVVPTSRHMRSRRQIG